MKATMAWRCRACDGFVERLLVCSDIEEDENEPELTYPYEEMDSINPPPPASKLEPEDAIEVENPIKHEDETVPASIHEVGESSNAPLLREDRKAKDEFYGKLILDLGNEVRSSVVQRTTTIEKLVEKLGNAKEKVECKKLKKELEKARIMPPKSAFFTQAAIRRMIKDDVDAAIAAERAREANVRNKASGSGLARGQDAAPAAHECTFVSATHKCEKVGHKSRYYKEKYVAMGANALPIPTCYDCGEQGHTRNRCPKKVKQEEVG
nr:hypothetical protein [Tanacetum cinerariifolium]